MRTCSLNSHSSAIFKFDVFAFLLISLLALKPAQAQLPDSGPWPKPVLRDEQAVAAVRSAISAMGGQGLSNVRSVVMQGEMNLPDGSSAQLLWTDDLTKPFPEFRRERSESGRATIFVSGHGKARFQDGSKLHVVPMHSLLANLPFHLPVVVLFRDLSDPKYSIEWIGPETLNGASVIHIKCVRKDDPVNAAVTPQDWYLDVSNTLPLKVAYRVPILRNAVKVEHASVEYSDFRNESGLLLPFALRHHPSSGNSETITVSAYSFNTPLAAVDFELSGDGQ